MKDKLSKDFIEKAIAAFDKYKADKQELNRRVMENDSWYKARYARIINPASNEAEPVTAFIFSAIENKFADAIDNYPVPNVLGREPSDRNLSELLTGLLPVQMEMSDFKRAYKINWRRKLKHGTGIYGVFYQGGKIKICPLSILNVYCDMHVGDVQDSPFLFIVNAVDNSELKKMYPQYERLFTGNANIEGFDGVQEAQDKTQITDCYYKKDGKVHCMKLCAGEVIAATELRGYPNGLYSHGKYPVVFDAMYPEEDCPFGFGVIDIAKNPQIYIDRLDGAIVKNAVLTSKIRFMIKDNGAVNEEEVIDCDNDIIHVAGSVDTDSIRELKTDSMPAYVLNHRSKKIDELKEIVGNRDFQQGGTHNGVTAASAITALQEAGSKLSRASIDDAYECYKQIVIMVIELIREFFTKERIVRICGDGIKPKYEKFSSKLMYRQGNIREPIEFDIDIVPQKQNPFQRETNNSTIIQLWQAGFFKPEMCNMSVIALEAMHFDGKDRIIDRLTEIAREQSSVKAALNGAATDDKLVPVEETAKDALMSSQNNTNQDKANDIRVSKEAE